MLQEIDDYKSFKKKFLYKFFQLLDEHIELKDFVFQLINQARSYIVGGFLRDIATGEDSRDMDMIIDCSHEKVLKTLLLTELSYTVNRFNGIKIKLNDFDVDIWSIENNWAFEKNVVKKNDDYMLESIAKGCFYNFDSLVINVHSNEMNVKNYNEMVQKNKLDILQKRTPYKSRNPTIEANILRAFYIRLKYGLEYTSNCNSYLTARIGHLRDKYGSSIERLLAILEKYPKYQEILDKDQIENLIEYCYDNEKFKMRL